MKTWKITWTHVRRSPYQSFAAIITMFLTFLLGGSVLVMSVASLAILHYFESKPQITVFFHDTATEEDANTLKKSLEASGNVSSIKYVSKEDALLVYKEQNKNDPLLLEMVTADILPASLEISPTDPKLLAELEPIIKESESVEEVVYQKDVVDALLGWTNAVRIVGGVLAILLSLDSLLIVMTIIGMKIAIKRDEIDILQLIGASPWYIRSPFLFEGGLYGVVGALFAWVIITGMVIWVGPYFAAFLGTIPAIAPFVLSPFSTTALVWYAALFGVLVTAGFSLGSIGSWIALSRFL